MTPGPGPGPDRPQQGDPQSEGPLRLPFSFIYAALLTVFTCFLYSLIAMIAAPLSGVFLIGHGVAVALSFANAAALAYRRTGGEPMELFALHTPHPSAWVAALLMLPALLLISEVDNWVVAVLGAPALPEAAPEAPAPERAPLLLAIGVIAVLVPLATEGFFRGLVFGRLEALGQGGAQAVIATTLLSWAFATLSRVLLTSGTELGPDPLSIARLSVHAIGAAALLGMLRLCSGSLYPPLLLAALFGLIEVAATRDLFGIPGYNDLSSAHTPLGWLLPAALLTGAGLRICARLPHVAPPAE